MTQDPNPLSAVSRLAEITLMATGTLKVIAEGRAQPDPVTLAIVMLERISKVQ